MQKPTDDELKAWERLPFNEEEYRKAEVGSDVLTGEPGYSVLYRTWARPTLEVHGIVGGFQAPGAKTVIPARASAKVSMRLVPNQDADDIFKKYSDYVKKITPKGIKTNIKIHSKGSGLRGEYRQSVRARRRSKPCTRSSRRIRCTSARAARFPSSPSSIKT